MRHRWTTSPVRILDSSRRESLIALQIEEARTDPSNITPLAIFSLLFVLRNSPVPDSIRRFPSAGRIMRDLAGRGKSYSYRRPSLPCFFRLTRKSSPQLSSPRDLRFLSDFLLEICIMYITARPFRKWETYLGFSATGGGADFSLPVFLSVPVAPEITRFHLNYNHERQSDAPLRLEWI